VPTPTDGDSSTKAATTAFVAAAIPYNINAATAKTTPVDADLFGIVDSAASNVLKKLSWINVKATLKTYFDTLYFPIAGASISGVRQTVQSGSVDTSGFPNFLTTSVDLNLPIAATTTPIVIHCAGGAVSNDKLVTISADTTLLVAASSTNYVYVNSAGTKGSTTLAPIYQFGGTPAVTNGQFTFNIGEMKAYLGNGTTAPQVYMTFIGEAVTSGSAVPSVVNYALNGLYRSADTAIPAPSTITSFNHNIGSSQYKAEAFFVNTTAEFGYSIGDIVFGWSLSSAANSPGQFIWSSGNKVAKTITGSTSTGIQATHATTGNIANLVAANWKQFITCKRSY